MMARASYLCLAVCLLAASAHAAPWVSGVATFTGEDPKATSVPNGACGYGTLTTAQFPGLKLAGVSRSKSILGKYALKGCGSCLEVRCTDKEACSRTTPMTVMVHDNCDGCETNQINLQMAPFGKLANPDVGRLRIEYREVPCAFSGGVVVRVGNFRTSGGGWVRLVFKNINGTPLDSVEIAKAGTDNFRPMKNVFGAAFEASRLPELPWDRHAATADLLIVRTGRLDLRIDLMEVDAVTSDQTGDIRTTKNF